VAAPSTLKEQGAHFAMMGMPTLSLRGWAYRPRAPLAGCLPERARAGRRQAVCPGLRPDPCRMVGAACLAAESQPPVLGSRCRFCFCLAAAFGLAANGAHVDSTWPVLPQLVICVDSWWPALPVRSWPRRPRAGERQQPPRAGARGGAAWCAVRAAVSRAHHAHAADAGRCAGCAPGRSVALSRRAVSAGHAARPAWVALA